MINSRENSLVDHVAPLHGSRAPVQQDPSKERGMAARGTIEKYCRRVKCTNLSHSPSLNPIFLIS